MTDKLTSSIKVQRKSYPITWFSPARHGNEHFAVKMSSYATKIPNSVPLGTTSSISHSHCFPY